MSPKSSSVGRSALVSTATTPGIARAADVSMRTMRARACGLRTVAPWSIPSRARSLAYSNDPCVFGGASLRGADSPTTPRSLVGGGASVVGQPHGTQRCPRRPCYGARRRARASLGRERARSPRRTRRDTTRESTSTRDGRSPGMPRAKARGRHRTRGAPRPPRRSGAEAARSNPLPRGAMHRLEDLAVPRAAADVPGERLLYLGVARLGIRAQQRDRGDDEAGRAEAALHRARVDERLLHGMHPLHGPERLDGADLAIGGRAGEDEARAHELSVHEHRARAALALLARVLAPREAEVIAQHREEALVILRLDAALGAVHAQADPHG